MQSGPVFADQWTNQTIAHPVGLAALAVLCLLALLLPRRFAVLPIVLLTCFIAPAQRLVIGGVDWSFLRLLVLAGWVRVLARGEWRGLTWRPLDTVLVAWAVCGTVIYTLQHGSLSAFVNRLGYMFDLVGMYLLFRAFMRSWQDVDRAVLTFMIVALPVAVVFLIERTTGRNMFAFLGGVPEITVVRDGRLRCQGAFSHPIVAGCFFALLMPLFAARWWRPGAPRWLTLAALLAAGLIVACTNSSTPIMAVLIGGLGGLAYFVRCWMRAIRWGALATLIALHLVMEAPVWHLLARIDVVGGSTGWHRYHLIDQAIRRLDEWFLLGTQSTAHWGYGLEDVTNQFVLEGVRGGFMTLALFVATLVLAFRAVGAGIRSAVQPASRAFAWAIGVMLVVHTACFISISYFGQIIVLWCLTLALARNVGAPRPQGALPARGALSARGAPRPQGAPAARRPVAAPRRAPGAAATRWQPQ